MRSILYRLKKYARNCCCMLLLMMTGGLLHAQGSLEKYIVKDGKMLIELSRKMSESALDSFIAKYDLYDLDLKQFLKTDSPDSLQKLGWKLEKSSRDKLVISKLLRGYDKFTDPADKIIFAEKKPSYSDLFPVTNTEEKYGYNVFRKKYPFLVRDSLVTFFLNGNTRARKVNLAGSFNEWDPEALSMRRTDSGWIANVKLKPGKHWYKFIIDGDWDTDNDNNRIENDGRGNNNSVYYKPNHTFRLNGFENAKKVFISGSFNNWRPRELMMTKTATGWQLPLYLGDGTHTYRFVVDGNWITDPENKERLPNEFSDFNSVIRIGKAHLFRLRGYTDAKEVILSGTFNNWRDNELRMTKTATGWELPYTIGCGNYEYRFRVDGKWMADPLSPENSQGKKPDKSFLVIGGNYTFRLKGFRSANAVFLSGDFNNWSPDSYLMKRDGDDWILTVFLTQGKHVYRYIPDGKWIADPGNHLWERNEYNTNNSVLWFDRHD